MVNYEGRAPRFKYVPDSEDPSIVWRLQYKVCARCNEDKRATEFHDKDGAGDGLQSYCMQCDADYKREYRAQYPESVLGRPIVEPTVRNKRCRDCGVFKGADEFHRNKRCRDGLHAYCKECRREAQVSKKQ